jgi:alpha-1,3-glucosyltransferase
MHMSLSTLAPLVLVSLVVRVAVGLWGHSGHGKPPMFGDFEAQRHWMEITTSLPMEDWYRNTTDNDLLYWGLDYPPLTAYTSQAFGIIAHKLHPNLVTLSDSRGHESIAGKLFMRASVLLCDIVLYFPAVAMFVTAGLASKPKATTKQMELIFVLCIFCPAMTLIDHGHFQYNDVSIALALLGGACILNDQDIMGSVFFCMSLNFKQMSLYYSPVFFFALLRKCFEKRKRAKNVSTFGSLASYLPSLWHLIAIGSTVFASFAALWLPFCVSLSSDNSCTATLLQILTRLFPFSRGIFEDKVSNLWYTMSVVFDFRNIVDTTVLIRASLGLTLLLLAPVGVDLMRKPISHPRLCLSLVNSALSFFLASFQVHEKSLLLALVPAAFLIPYSIFEIGWFQFVGCMTMYPLLVKDGQRIPYFIMMLMYGIILQVMSDASLLKQIGVKLALDLDQSDEDTTSSSSSGRMKKGKLDNTYILYRAVSWLKTVVMFISCAGTYTHLPLC